MRSLACVGVIVTFESRTRSLATFLMYVLYEFLIWIKRQKYLFMEIEDSWYVKQFLKFTPVLWMVQCNLGVPFPEALAESANMIVVFISHSTYKGHQTIMIQLTVIICLRWFAGSGHISKSNMTPTKNSTWVFATALSRFQFWNWYDNQNSGWLRWFKYRICKLC